MREPVNIRQIVPGTKIALVDGALAEVENYEWEGFRVPGTVCDLTQAKSSEHNLRNLYRRWAEFMAAESWDELMTWRRPARAEAAE